MKKIIIIFILCFSGFIAFSQTVTEVRQMRLNAMEVFDNYTATLKNLDVPNSYVWDNFVQLFHPDAVVYNDILPDNIQQILSPENYYEKYIQLIKSDPKLSDLELSMPYQENGKWYVKVNFKKSFSIRLKQYDSFSYPEYTFNCEMLVEMTENQQYVPKENYSKRELNENVNLPYISAKIKNLSVKEPLQDFFIIELNDSKLSNNKKGLYYNHQKVEFTDHQNRKIFNTEEYNIFNFTLNPELNADDYKRTIKQNQLDNHYYKYDVSQLKNLVGVQVSYIPNFWKPYSFDNNLNITAHGMGVSLLYSRLIAETKNGINWYVNVSPGYLFNIVNIDGNNKEGYNTKFKDAIDSHDAKYERNISLSNISEKNIFHSFDLPFGVGLAKNIKSVSLTADLGFWLNYIFLQTHNSSIDTAIYSGFYKELCPQGLTLYDYYDFGTFKTLNKDIDETLKKFDLGIYAAIGVMFKLKDYWYLKTSVEYRFAFINPNYNSEWIKTLTKDTYEPFYKSINNRHRFQINVGIIRKL
jgi:hypothetical protein